MELFDKKFVHFMWDDELEGKKCFVGGDIDILRAIVEKGVESDLHSIVFSRNESAPFRMADGTYSWQFAYYDPNYAVKKAFNEGKKIQYRIEGFVDWEDYTNQNPCWDDEDREWRVKPDCPCEDGIDSKACVGCEHSEDGKQYRPYRDALEFIADFGKRFPTATPRPLGTMPLIWIAHKTDGTTRLIVEFSDRSVKIGCKVKPVDFGKLFEYWTYTDGSPVGMEC